MNLHFIQTSLLMLPLTHSSHNTLVSTCVKAQLKQLTQAKIIAQAKWGFSKIVRVSTILGKAFSGTYMSIKHASARSDAQTSNLSWDPKNCFEGFLEILITLDLHNFSQVHKKLCEKITKLTYKNKNQPINYSNQPIKKQELTYINRPIKKLKSTWNR